jgi:hypothetical protein
MEQRKLRVCRTWNNFVKQSANFYGKLLENLVTNVTPHGSMYNGSRMAVRTNLRLGEKADCLSPAARNK